MASFLPKEPYRNGIENFLLAMRRMGDSNRCSLVGLWRNLRIAESILSQLFLYSLRNASRRMRKSYILKLNLPISPIFMYSYNEVITIVISVYCWNLAYSTIAPSLDARRITRSLRPLFWLPSHQRNPIEIMDSYKLQAYRRPQLIRFPSSFNQVLE